MQKESVELHVMWHIDALLHSFPITIVTTIDGQGRINAAPYSLVVPFCSSPKNPQMLLIANKKWHTAKNIEETGEFVLNYPRADQVREINETARLYPEGFNELDHTIYTTTPARFVRPPRIIECYQHIECRVKETIRPSQTQLNFIAEVLDLSLDKGLYEIPRVERAKKVNAPVYLGIDEYRHHVFGKIDGINSAPIDLGVD
ncbi:MAG: flavin reductase family protein [Deltaproteobacteria bacterium]|nr:flavin reductase family protein [Deltaproteobacteria bacterium]